MGLFGAYDWLFVGPQGSGVWELPFPDVDELVWYRKSGRDVIWGWYDMIVHYDRLLTDDGSRNCTDNQERQMSIWSGSFYFLPENQSMAHGASGGLIGAHCVFHILQTFWGPPLILWGPLWPGAPSTINGLNPQSPALSSRPKSNRNLTPTDLTFGPKHLFSSVYLWNPI